MTWNGTTWSPSAAAPAFGTNYPSGLSCAATSFCVAADPAGEVSTWNGTAWSTPVSVVPTGYNPYGLDVSCATSGACAATGQGIALIGKLS